MYGNCVPVAVAALTVLILGKWNPALLQKKINGRATGEVDPLLLAIAAATAGLGTCAVMKMSKKSNALDF